MSKIKKSYVNINSGQIHYRYIEGDGLPLLFFHRTPSSSIMFERLMFEMKNDRPLFAFDTPGFGESFNPVGMPSLEDYRDWFIEVINKIGLDQFHIYAHHTGTHIASEIGTMRVSEQIDALETLSFDPISFLIMPRIISGAIMFPIMIVIADLFGILGGYFAATISLGISPYDYIYGLRDWFVPWDAIFGVIKAFSFGIVCEYLFKKYESIYSTISVLS